MRSLIKTKASKASYMGIFAAMLVVLSIFESRLGINFGVPGVKVGLSNIVLILALMIFDLKSAAFLAIVKIMLSLVLTSGISGFMFTAFGTLSSLFVMSIAKWLLKEKVTALGISVLGGTAHITAQYLCSAVLMKTFAVWGMYPASALISVITSAAVGIICNLILERKLLK